MKKVLLTATFVLASFGAFASNAAVKSNAIVPVKNNLEVMNISNSLNADEQKQAPTCTVSVNLGIVSFSYTWEC
jgi:hypothetical protein